MYKSVKPFYENHDITEVENILRANGLEIDKHDGVISFLGKDETIPFHTYTQTLQLTYRDVLVSIDSFDEHVEFYYRTTKDSTFPSKEHRNIMPCEDWFELIERIAHILARQTGKNYVAVSTGRLDAHFVKSRGYKKRKGETFYEKPL